MPSTMEENTRFVSRLNDEVVYEIFKFLSLADRQNARLVCKQWHSISNRRIFVQNEAFFISIMYSLRPVVEVLNKCERQMLNLKFEQRLFGDDSKILWRKLGRRIQSLKFTECRFPPDIIRTIFLRCKNLNEFSACCCCIEGLSFYRDDSPPNQSLLQIGDDVVRPNLRILDMDGIGLTGLTFKECDLHLISSAFPQLTRLKIQLLLNDERNGDDTPNFTILLNILDSKLTCLEELSLKYPLCLFHYPIDFTSVSPFNLDRLKRVSMELRPFILNSDSFNKILSYKFWTSLNISLSSTFEDDATLVTRLLNESPLLEELEIFIPLSRFLEFSKLFKALVKSRLKSLKVELSDGGWPSDFTRLFISVISGSFEELPCNGTVEYLSVHCKSIIELTSLFVKYFRNVRDLSARPADISTVFKYQRNLKSLIIEPLGSWTDEEPVNRCIESLEYIDMRPLVMDTFIQYQFPNLKYLVLDDSKMYRDKILSSEAGTIASADGNINEGNGNSYDWSENRVVADNRTFIEKTNVLMSSIFRKSPHLEAIEFNCDYLLNAEAFIVFFQSCIHFHQLRYVSLYTNSVLLNKMTLKREVAKYLKKCPSFRGFWFQSWEFNVYYYFNVVAKKYEFSNEYSSSSFCGRWYSPMRLKEFWRYKR